MIALILCVVGGIDEVDSGRSEISAGRKYTKIGVVIFLLMYLLLSALVVITMKDAGNAREERSESTLQFWAPSLCSASVFSGVSSPHSRIIRRSRSLAATLWFNYSWLYWKSL
jgi:hypothetical protein